MSYEVYLLLETITIPDPEMPTPRYHHKIFICTSPTTSSGTIHHVTGDITSGMYYASTPFPRPEDIETFYSKELLGTIFISDYPQELDRVLSALPPPGKQKAFNLRMMQTEQVKPDGGFYGAGEERPRMVKCTEWTIERAIPALYASGILRK